MLSFWKWDVDFKFLLLLLNFKGYPVAALPLSYLEYNGRSFGLAAIASERQEKLLIQLMSTWETTFRKRKPPPGL